MKNLILHMHYTWNSISFLQNLKAELSLVFINEYDIIREEHGLGTSLGLEHYDRIRSGTIFNEESSEDLQHICNLYHSKFKRSPSSNFLFINNPKNELMLSHFEKLHGSNDATFCCVHILVDSEKIYKQKSGKAFEEVINNVLDNYKNNPVIAARYMKKRGLKNEDDLRLYIIQKREKERLSNISSARKWNHSIHELMKNHPILTLDADLSEKQMFELAVDFWKNML